MKIGILTYHNAINYGGVLQAYALQQYLNGIEGLSVEVIDYHSPAVEQQYSWISFKKKISLKGYILLNATTVARRKKKVLFNEFVRNNLKLSSYIKEVTSNTLEQYDVIIVGSDQVWNAVCTKGDKTYLLDIDGVSTKRISYAASIGSMEKLNKFQTDYHVDYKKALSGFSNISLREQDAADYIENILGKKCSVVVDPVFLFGREKWINYTRRMKNALKTNKEYILVYNIGNFPLIFKFSNTLSKVTGLGLRVINKDIKGDVKFAKKKNCSNVSPEEFVFLIENARYVVTDSFHATAFSLLFHRKFFTIENPYSDNTNSRLLNILNNYQLGDRYITIQRVPDNYDREIDYGDIDRKMMRECEKSRRWLLDALGWEGKV